MFAWSALQASHLSSAGQLLSSSSDTETDGQMLVESIVVVLMIAGLFWSIHRKVKSGTMPPVARRTIPHSRRYLIIIASINIVTVIFFVTMSVVSLVRGHWQFGVALLLLAGMITAFVIGNFRLGSDLRREALPDRAPTIQQRTLPRWRRILLRVVGILTGLMLFGTIRVAVEKDWGSAIVGAVIVAVGYGGILWLNRPARLAEG